MRISGASYIGIETRLNADIRCAQRRYLLRKYARFACAYRSRYGTGDIL
jgi:hypothetical protein